MISYAVSIVPVLLYLVVLLLMDSFSVIRKGRLTVSVLYGMVVCVLLAVMPHVQDEAANVVFPVLEEILKAAVIFLLIEKKKIAFFIDAAIYGAGVGSGFALMENILYVFYNPDMLITAALFRGMGTAVMHAGCTAVVSVFAIIMTKSKHYHLLMPLVVLPSIGLHVGFNFLVNSMSPLILLSITFITITFIFVLLSIINERLINKWLDESMNDQIGLLSAIKKGDFPDTNCGRYLLSIKAQFAPEVVLDMYCYITIFLELTLKAKGNMMLHESGIELSPLTDSERKETKAAVDEFYTLRKKIGRTGIIALEPIVHINNRNEWMINSMK